MKEKIIEILKKYHTPFINGVSVTEYDLIADDVISLFSQPNGGDRVVSENEPEEEFCVCGHPHSDSGFRNNPPVCRNCFKPKKQNDSGGCLQHFR